MESRRGKRQGSCSAHSWPQHRFENTFQHQLDRKILLRDEDDNLLFYDRGATFYLHLSNFSFPMKQEALWEIIFLSDVTISYLPLHKNFSQTSNVRVNNRKHPVKKFLPGKLLNYSISHHSRPAQESTQLTGGCVCLFNFRPQVSRLMSANKRLI